MQGYNIQPGDTILRTEMEAGLARQRRRFTNAPTKVSVRWIMRRDQYAIFEGWYRWHAKEGANWFAITLLGGLGLLDQEARFTRQFASRLLAGGTLWEITSELEIRERPVLDEGLLNLLLSEDPLFATKSCSDRNALPILFTPATSAQIRITGVVLPCSMLPLLAMRA